jgi:hypothetical protein
MRADELLYSNASSFLAGFGGAVGGDLFILHSLLLILIVICMVYIELLLFSTGN